MKTIQIEVSERLAKEYQKKYLEAFPSREFQEMPTEQFISRFLEDRLHEEIEFVENELQEA